MYSLLLFLKEHHQGHNTVYQQALCMMRAKILQETKVLPDVSCSLKDSRAQENGNERKNEILLKNIHIKFLEP